MIESIKLTNFKAHADLTIADLPQITVIVGRNNVGKSSFLHAAALPKYGPSDNPNLPIGPVAEMLHAGSEKGSVELSYAPGEPTLRLAFTSKGDYAGGWVPAPPKRDHSREVFFISPARQIFRSFPYVTFSADVGVTGENAPNVLHQLKANDDPRFFEILGWLKAMDLGVTSLPIPTADPGEGRLDPVAYGTRTNILLHGSGLRTILPIIVQGVLCSAGSVLLLEEPEAHLHRATIDQLWGFLGDCARRGIQTIATTHSLDFCVSLNERLEGKKIEAKATLLQIQRDEGGATSQRRLDPALFRNIGKLIKEDLAGWHLA